MLFEGAPGIGKSRLLGAACEAAETLGVQVLRARGGELERDFSYGVVRQLFETRLASCGDAAQIVAFPVLGLQASLDQNLKLALVFTAVSIVRSYAAELV